jgi:microcin-processing metallopeptidase PmbA/TldD-like protein
MRMAAISSLCSLILIPACFGQGAVDNDLVLQAMRAEMERSKANLKLEQVSAPYYIEYRVNEIEERLADAAFGALRGDIHTHIRFLRVTVRIGDYKQDSFYQQGEGVGEFMPLDNDMIAMRHQIWLATDKAYKAAAQALTAKQAALKQFNVEQPVDDFARSTPVQLVEPPAKLDIDPGPWQRMLQTASAVYKDDPQIQAIDAQMRFEAVSQYFLNSEGTIVRSGHNDYQLNLAMTTQASDGMRLDRSHSYVVANIKELPSEREFLDKANELAASLKLLREAPIVDDEYRGPVLFSADAASSVFADFVGQNVLATKPPLGQPARTGGAWATSYKSRVLPNFISVADDPTVATANGHSLLGHYAVDDEGVKAQRVDVIEDGKLMNFVIGRLPIRDFPASNGHGRGRLPATPPGPSLGNLIVHSSDAVPISDLKNKLIEICKQRDLPFGYYVETLGPRLAPRLLYKVYVKDGHQELVRGAVFGDLDTRAIRNDLVAAGNDVYVDNRVLNIPHSIVNPSILFDELQVKRANANKEKLPEYPAPTVASGK